MTGLDRLFESTLQELASRLSPQERSEFVNGLLKHIARIDLCNSGDEMRAVAADLLRFVRGWAITVLMRTHEDWRQQVQETAGPPDGDEEPVDAAELRNLLGV